MLTISQIKQIVGKMLPRAGEQKLTYLLKYGLLLELLCMVMSSVFPDTPTVQSENMCIRVDDMSPTLNWLQCGRVSLENIQT